MRWLCRFRDAKKTLPKPKVGDFCSIAMEQGFSDACVALCMDEKPVARLAQSCRSAAVEMPRPTVRRWCEHGYRTAFDKTINDLREHFKPDGVAGTHHSYPRPSSSCFVPFTSLSCMALADQRQKVVQERADAAEAQRQADIKARTEQAAAAKDARDAAAAAAAAARVASEAAPAAAKEASGAGKAAKASEKEAAAAEGAAIGARKTLETTAAKVVEDKAAAAAKPAAPAGTEATGTGTERAVHATITITVDDNNETQLVVYEGQTAEEAVVEYCQTNAADDTAGCIRQLLPVVIEKLGE